MHTILTLHHVHLKATWLREMIERNEAVVRLKPQHVAPAGAWLTNDAASHHLALLVFPGISDDADKDSDIGIHHTAFEFFSLGKRSGTSRGCQHFGLHPHFFASITL